ncbi:MAG: hypothetical protein AAF602_14105, partial [Myxococcota bacterium]
KAAAAGGQADCDPLTGLESRAHFLSTVRDDPSPRILVCIGVDPVGRGKPSRSRFVVRKMAARAGSLMTKTLQHADHRVHWEPTLLVASFPVDHGDVAFGELEALRTSFADLVFAGGRGPAVCGSLTSALAEWREPTDTALASALLRSRAGVAGAQLRGGNRIVCVDEQFGAILSLPLIA